MEQVSVYKTNDGEMFESEKEAQAHEEGQSFDTWYRTNLLYASQPGSYVYLSDLKKYVAKNADQIRKLLPEE